MFCPNCGCNNPDYAAACAACGTVLREQAQPNGYQPYQQQNNYQPQNNYQQPNPQQPNGYQPYQNQPYYGQMNSPLTPTHPMKWFKFLIYFLLFVSALGHVANGVMHMTGSIHTNANGRDFSDALYRLYPAIETLDLFVAIASFGMAVLSLVARFRLAAYRQKSGDLVTALYFTSAVINIIYAIALIIITESSLEDADLSMTFTSVAITLAIGFANKAYFNKRKDLFTK